MAGQSTRAVVYPVQGRDADVSRLEQIIAASCEIVCEQAKRQDVEQCLQRADVLVVLIVAATPAEPALEKAILSATRAGKRVVGVWAPGTSKATLPAAINKYADATVIFDPKTVQKAVCGGEPLWLDPGGDPRPKPKTPRHKGK